MYDVDEQKASLRRFRTAALLAVVIPAALLAAGCSSAAATDGLCAPATAPDAACPRLTGARQHPIAGFDLTT